jgi:hypothetical protein
MSRMLPCRACDRKVAFRRHYGAGTAVLFLATAGLWLLAMPFYPVRCHICGGPPDRAKALRQAFAIKPSSPLGRWLSSRSATRHTPNDAVEVQSYARDFYALLIAIGAVAALTAVVSGITRLLRGF